MNWRLVSNKRTIYFDDQFGVLYKKGKLYVCNSSFCKEELLGKIYTGFPLNIFARLPILERIFRLAPRCAKKISEKEIIFSCHGFIYRVDIREKHIFKEHSFRSGMRNPLQLCKVNNVEGFEDCIIYGEYWSNPSLDKVCIFRRTAQQTWEKAYEFPQGSILHIHGFCVDAFNKRILILTGDQDEQSGIWEAKNNFRDVSPVLRGKQQYRACQAFIDNSIIYATDTPIEQNYLYCITDNNICKKIYEMPGPCIYGCSFFDKEDRQFFLFATSVEPDSTQKGVRYLLSYKLGPGVTERKVFIVYGSLATGFKKVPLFQKDFFPMALCEFGNVLFPENCGEQILVCPQSVKKYNGKTLVITL